LMLDNSEKKGLKMVRVRGKIDGSNDAKGEGGWVLKISTRQGGSPKGRAQRGLSGSSEKERNFLDFDL